jgi:hypothetical protein
MFGTRLKVVAFTAVLLPAAIGAVLVQQASRPSRLFKDARQMLAIARAQGRTEVSLLIATVPGGVPAVASRAEQLGASVRYREEEIGYIRVRVPIDRASDLAEFDRIEAVTVDVTNRDPGRLMPQQDTGRWPPTWSDYPLRHPYLAIRDIDAAEFQAQHPTFDGRGVTIVLLDGSVDFLLPEYQTAYSLDGKPIPKIADYVNVTDPREDAAEMGQWVDMKETVNAQGGRLSYRGKTFTAPRDGSFRIGFFDERRFNNPSNAAYMDQDIDRNGNPRGDDGLFGVLWDEQSGDVWVDTNRDLSFADQKKMTDFIKRGDLGVFGTDDPKTPIRESIGFAVQTDAKNKFVALNVGIYQHATEIMGHVIGNREPGGRLQGVAPGARLISMFYGVGNAHGLIEGLIAAFKHPLSDLIVLEQSVFIASVPYLLADGRHPISIIAQRLTERYQKLLFVPGGNAPGNGLVAEDGLAPAAVSVGGYQNRESYRLNNGLVPEPADNLHWGALSHGPSGVGALKPDLLAPSGQMSVDLGYLYRKTSQELRGLYQLPPGYFVDGGTSTATPMAAGAAALVVSAAKQTRVPYDAMRLKAALTGSARYIPRLAAHEQGSGLVQVRAAYELLESMQNTQLVTITSRAPVRTRLSALLHVPHTGVGIYEREGWSVGTTGTRTITFTRTSGPAAPMTFALNWQGNDATFSSASSVILPLNRPVDVPVSIAARNAGIHSAILTLDHASTPGHDYQVLNTVVVPVTLTAENKYTVTQQLTLPRPGDRGLFIHVPAGANAMRFSATSDDGGAVRLRAIAPGRSEINPCSFTAPAGQACTLPSPEPGVWEISASMNDMVRDFDPGRPSPLGPARVTVTAALLGIGIGADTAFAQPLKAGGAFDIPVKLTNQFGVTSAALTSGALGSAQRSTRQIARGQQHVFEVTVPRGSTSLRARVSELTADADLDIYLLDCTVSQQRAAVPPDRDKGNKAPPDPAPNCPPRAKAATVEGGGEVEVLEPAAGRWVIVVDAYRLPSERVSYNYLDVFTHPQFGSVAVVDSEESRTLNAAWTSTAHLWVAALPDAGRSLWGRLIATSRDAKTSTGAPIVLGSFDLALAAVRSR